VIGYSMHSSVEDMSRLGLLILRKGGWEGRQLLSERFVYRMTHPAFEDTNTGYGYLTQLNAHHGWTYSTGTNDTCVRRIPPGPAIHMHRSSSLLMMRASLPSRLSNTTSACSGQRAQVDRKSRFIEGSTWLSPVRDDVASLDDGTIGTFEGHKHVWTEIRPALVALDVTTGEQTPFVRNHEPGPASRAGIERPVACRFSPEGRSLYVLDFGQADVNENALVAYAHTGVLWRITKTGGA
jgi:hypothetical protein